MTEPVKPVVDFVAAATTADMIHIAEGLQTRLMKRPCLRVTYKSATESCVRVETARILASGKGGPRKASRMCSECAAYEYLGATLLSLHNVLHLERLVEIQSATK